jgi:diguanylate cyclase (GGDEF)-like protein
MRLIAGLGIMLLPLVGMGLGAFVLLEQAIQFLDEIEEEASDELLPAARLRQLLSRSYKPVKNYIIHGGQEEREEFLRLAEQVDQAFDEVLSASLDVPEEADLLLDAQELWAKETEVSKEILMLADPADNEMAMQKMDIMDDYFDQVLTSVERANVLMLHEMESYSHVAREYFQRVYVLAAGTIAVGVILSIVAVLLIAGSILHPLKTLQLGVRRFGSGSLSHRIGQLSTDEFGELALAFDSMADKLEEMAARDSLTRLFNRREFLRYLTAELKRSERYHHSMALLMLDIDHFKSVNDQHGHQVGDEALKAMAARISRNVRSVDHVSRYGGEEIILILPETERQEALSMADQLRARIEKDAFQLPSGLEITLTASIGVAVFPTDARTESQLVAAADAAVYEAKNEGRNCVRGYETTG